MSEGEAPYGSECVKGEGVTPLRVHVRVKA